MLGNRALLFDLVLLFFNAILFFSLCRVVPRVSCLFEDFVVNDVYIASAVWTYTSKVAFPFAELALLAFRRAVMCGRVLSSAVPTRVRFWISTLVSRGSVVSSLNSASTLSSLKVRFVVYSKCRLGFNERRCRGALKGVEGGASAYSSLVQIDLL